MKEEQQIFYKTVQLFKHYGYYENSLISKDKLYEIFDKQSRKQASDSFPREILDEVWGQSQTLSQSEATVLTIAKVIMEGTAILRDRIDRLQGTGGGLQRKTKEIQNKKEQLKQLESLYQHGYQTSNEAINNLRKNITFLEAKKKQLDQDYQNFKSEHQRIIACLQLPEAEQMDYTITKPIESYFQPQQSPHLLPIFRFALACLLLQLIILTFRPPFLALLSYLHVFYFLFIGYYDASFVGWVITELILSAILDFGYVALDITQRFTLMHIRFSGDIIFQWVSMIFLLITAILRFVLACKLWNFREVSENQEYFELFGHKIYLNKRGGKIYRPPSPITGLST